MMTHVWYRVTRKSDDSTFHVGDHIILDPDGSIICREAEGWIEAEDVLDAVRGMECERDEGWVHKRIKTLRDEIEHLKGMET